MKRLFAGGTDRRWGLIGITGLVAVIAVITAMTVVDTGRTEYLAKVSDAGSISTGDDVRLAGIPVGEITAIDLQSDGVQVRFTVDSEVFVGDETSLSIRMLTAVGGYYLALNPAGSKPLGDKMIPSERVITPYSLPDLFQDAVTPLRDIEGDHLRATFAELQSAATDSPDGIRAAVAATDSIVEILDRQNADISRTLAMAQEYVVALDENRALVKQIIDSWNTLETLAEQSLVKVGQTLGTVATILERLGPIGQQWDDRIRPMALALSESVPPLQDLLSKWTELVASIKDFGELLKPMAGEREPLTICVPVPERSC